MSATGEVRRTTGEAGTTLIEALVAVSIAAAISAIAFPAMRQAIAGLALGQAAAGVRADLRIARAQAITSGRRVDILVSSEGRHYGWTPGPLRVLTAGLSMSPAGMAVSFHPDGSSSGGWLSLGNGRASARFEIDAVTGLPKAAS